MAAKAPSKPDPLGVECPYCGASPNCWCASNPLRETRRRLPLSLPHAARVRAAERAEKGEKNG